MPIVVGVVAGAAAARRHEQVESCSPLSLSLSPARPAPKADKRRTRFASLAAAESPGAGAAAAATKSRPAPANCLRSLCEWRRTNSLAHANQSTCSLGDSVRRIDISRAALCARRVLGKFVFGCCGGGATELCLCVPSIVLQTHAKQTNTSYFSLFSPPERERERKLLKFCLEKNLIKCKLAAAAADEQSRTRVAQLGAEQSCDDKSSRRHFRLISTCSNWAARENLLAPV